MRTWRNWRGFGSSAKRHINTTRYLLLDMRDRKGWKALGYESFKEYGEKELNYQERHLYRLVDAAEIGMQIGTDQLDSQPPESHLRPLTAVPEDVRKQIWDEATKKAEADGDKRTAKPPVIIFGNPPNSPKTRCLPWREGDNSRLFS